MNSNGLRLSIVANILLAGVVVLLVHRKQANEGPPSETTALSHTALQTQAPAASLSPEPVSVAPAFRWSQLESTNYRTYIANLRGIECPEQTIRDIITADVDEAFYAPQREQLKEGRTAQAVASALQELNEQEASLIASLLGTQPPASRAVADTARVPRIHVESQAERILNQPASTPLALQSVDPGTMNLTDTQMQTLSDIRQNFLNEIGGTNQDPNDPAYRNRWQTAQREADDMLVGMLGMKFVQSYRAQLESQVAQTK